MAKQSTPGTPPRPPWMRWQTVARECIAADVAYILEWFNIPIDTEEAIRERDW